MTAVRAEDDDVQLAGKQDMVIVLGIDGVMRANESTPVPAGALFIHRGGPLALKGEDAAAAGVLLSAAAARERAGRQGGRVGRPWLLPRP